MSKAEELAMAISGGAPFDEGEIVLELRSLAAVESELEALKVSLGEPVAWRYKAFAVVDGDRVPVREVDTARDEYTITQQKPHDWSHLHYPLDYPTYEDYEPLYALTKETK